MKVAQIKVFDVRQVLAMSPSYVTFFDRQLSKKKKKMILSTKIAQLLTFPIRQVFGHLCVDFFVYFHLCPLTFSYVLFISTYFVTAKEK